MPVKTASVAPFQQDSIDIEHRKLGKTSKNNHFEEGLEGPFSSNIFNKPSRE